MCVADGQSYERAAITEWLAAHDISPVTRHRLATKDLLPNYALRSLIQAARESQRT